MQSRIKLLKFQMMILGCSILGSCSFYNYPWLDNGNPKTRTGGGYYTDDDDYRWQRAEAERRVREAERRAEEVEARAREAERQTKEKQPYPPVNTSRECTAEKPCKRLKPSE